MPSDLDLVRSRLLDLVQGDARITVEDCDKWIDTQNSDGTWPDLEYARNQRGGWPPQVHWRRIRDLSFELGSGRYVGARKEQVEGTIAKAIAYWLEDPPLAVNWWYNCIGIPLEMGPTLLALGDFLDDETRDRIIGLMNYPPAGPYTMPVGDGAYARTATGQNLVWLAWIQLMMGVATENEVWIQQATGEVSDEVVITTDEGIQPDFSFHQHGAQYYSGGYGFAFVSWIGDTISVVHGTKYALTPEAEAVFLEYLLEGQRWIVRGRNVLFHARGREVARPFRGTSSLGVVAGRMADVGFPRSYELRSLAESVEADRPLADLDGVKVFYRSDVAIQQTEAFSTSVRGTSFRLRAGESGNGENILGQFLAHGTHAILLRGDEYNDVFPLWDWHRIPGSLIAPKSRLSLFDWGNDKPNESGFVGGVSSGRSGAFGYDYRFDGTAAKRSWFMTDGGLIQLVADVSDREERVLVQTLNQCRAEGPVLYRSDGPISSQPESFGYNGYLRTVVHAGVAYVFPQRRVAQLRAETRTGSWQTINLSGSSEPYSADMFSLSFTLTPDDRLGYHYFILPGGSPGIQSAEKAIERWDVVRNDGECQAVHDRERNELLVNFYTKGWVSLPGGFTLTARQPCSVVLQFSGESVAIHAADPTKSLEKIELSINVGARSRDGTIVGGADYTNMEIKLPEGGVRGQAIEPIVLTRITE